MSATPECRHMFQRVDALHRFICADCGAFCGVGEYVEIDKPMTRSQVDAMRSEFEMQKRDEPEA